MRGFDLDRWRWAFARGLLLLLLAVVGVGVGAGALQAEARAAAAEPGALPDYGADSVWVWSWDDPGLLAADLASAGFGRAYLYAQGGFGPRVKAAISALTARGVEVEALGGERRWATSQRRGMLEFVAAAREYQRQAPAGAELAGIHVDVEPYALAAWDRNESRTARRLLASLRAARRAAGTLPLAADMPFWFDGVELGRGGPSLARRMIAATDAITLMAYRDTGPDVAGVARREIKLAGMLGRRLTVGVETGDVRPEQVTFFEEGATALTRALAYVDRAFAGRRGFGGTAIHHYGSLADLPQ